MSTQTKKTAAPTNKQPPRKTGAPVKSTKTAEAKQSVTPYTPVGNERALKRTFFISLLCMLGIFWFTGYNVGFSSDEMDMNAYGKANIAYYMSGGKDTSFLHPSLNNGSKMDATLPYYGSDFEYIADGFNKMTGLDKGKQEFNSRHAINQLFAVLAILFAGLLSARIGGFKAALFTSWLLFLTPTFFGHGLMNTKDIPFCTGYIASLYFIICFIGQLPRPNWKTVVALILSIAFTLGTRIGGMLVEGYLFLFIGLWALNKNNRIALLQKENSRRVLLQLVAVVGGSLLITVLAWPFVLRNPTENLMAAVNVAKNFPAHIKMNFGGDTIFSLDLPSDYLTTHLFITIPVFIITCIIASAVLFVVKYKTVKWQTLLLVAFASVFPLAYAIKTHMPVYCGWRHFLFIYPGLTIVAGNGLGYAASMLKKPSLQYSVAGVSLLALINPITWSIRNHPYEYVYYNEASGGFKNCYYNYETDYWEISVKNSIDWLFAHEPIMRSKDSVMIATNAYSFTDYYIKRHFPGCKVRVIASGDRSRCFMPWRYFVLNTLFLETYYLQSFYPPDNTVQTTNIDGMPETAIIKDTRRYDYKAYRTFDSGNTVQADSLLKLYNKMYKRVDPAAYALEGIIDIFNNDMQKGHDYSVKALSYDPENIYGHIAMGIYCMRTNNMQGAYTNLTNALALQPRNSYVQQMLVTVKAALHIK